METSTGKQSYSLFDGMDSSLQENIIKLDQKLKGLRAEIAAKLESPFLFKQDNRDLYVERLSAVAEEINTAIENLETVVSLVSSENEELTNAFLQSDEMREFSEMISENLEKIAEIKANL